MKRGWRNDPAWVAYYEARQREYYQRLVAIAKLNMAMYQITREEEMRAKADKARQSEYFA